MWNYSVCVFCVCVCMHNFILNVKIHKNMDNPLHLNYINICHYSKQPHCCHIGYACAGPCHDVFMFCNITIPCHIWCASTMSTRTCSVITQALNFLVTLSSALGSGHYLADPTVKMSNIFLYSPEHLATIDFLSAVKINFYSGFSSGAVTLKVRISVRSVVIYATP